MKDISQTKLFLMIYHSLWLLFSSCLSGARTSIDEIGKSFDGKKNDTKDISYLIR